MIEEAIKIGLAAGVAVVFFVVGLICTGIAIAALLDLICLPFRVIKNLIEKWESDRRWKSDPIFSRFKQ